MEALLETSGLSVGYGKHVLFKDLDLKVNSGELICFMGPNGSGKSSLLRTLAGIQKAISGEVSYNQSHERSKFLSVVLTDRIGNPGLTAEEVVAAGRIPFQDWTRKLSAEDISIVNDCMKLTGCSGLASTKMEWLSDGQRQLVMLARALAQSPKVLLLDEPTAHLDLNNRVEVMNLLRSLCRSKGLSVMVCTHELDLALQTADCIWLSGEDDQLITGVPEDLVLNGAVDRIFKLKGFTLKTGKLEHQISELQSVSVEGSGFGLLWTKNALERKGYRIAETSNNHIAVVTDGENISWSIHHQTCHSIRELLAILQE
ncbi:MAG: ABC transporter ATP-binding protein [Bacteroidetes bacterium]|nr:ABC transporter ATP-binding protein [Bacteroidota bacterium]